MKSKIIGGVLLIIGTSLGGGMLALPLATAAGGYFHSLWLFLAVWALTVFAAFLLLEVTLWLPEDSNLISMARATLGGPGQAITWLIYLLLLYTLLSAYISGGSALLDNFFVALHLPIPRWLDSVLFVVLLGSIVYLNIMIVDWANRGLMIIKMSAYVVLIILISFKVHLPNLMGGQYHALSSGIMVIVTAFGYSIVIPSLRRYFGGNVRVLRITIGVASVAIFFT